MDPTIFERHHCAIIKTYEVSFLMQCCALFSQIWLLALYRIQLVCGFFFLRTLNISCDWHSTSAECWEHYRRVTANNNRSSIVSFTFHFSVKKQEGSKQANWPKSDLNVLPKSSMFYDFHSRWTRKFLLMKLWILSVNGSFSGSTGSHTKEPLMIIFHHFVTSSSFPQCLLMSPNVICINQTIDLHCWSHTYTVSSSYKMWGLLSFPISKWNEELALIWKEDFIPLSNGQICFLFS